MNEGLAGVSHHLDYRSRYPTLRSVVLHWDSFLDNSGKFLRIMWDAPVALWEFFSPELDSTYKRPEAAMLREGLGMAKGSLTSRNAAAAGGRGQLSGEGVKAGKLLELDLGPGHGFAALAERCFEMTEGDYLYKLCPFKDAHQGISSLGRWAGWGGAGSDAGGQMTMLYREGSRCHGKVKSRSAEVIVACGPEHALVGVEEPETCWYRLVLETPLGCTDQTLKEAELQLERVGVRYIYR
ncbi:unnamed protein product [Choristocarpus tenellus]